MPELYFDTRIGQWCVRYIAEGNKPVACAAQPAMNSQYPSLQHVGTDAFLLNIEAVVLDSERGR